MKKIFLSPLAGCLVASWFCAMAANAAPAKQDDPETVATINALMERVSRTAETLDAEKTLAPLTRDKEAVFFFDAKPYTRSELTHCLGRIYGSIRSMSIRMDRTWVKVLGPDAAVWIGCGKGKSVDSSGRTFEEYLTETWVWRRSEGKWEVIHSHESVVSLPSAERKARAEKALAEFAGKLRKRSPTRENIRGLIEGFLAKHRDLTGSAFAMCPDGGAKASFHVYRNGAGFAHRGAPESYDYTAAEWYAKAAKSGKPEWSEPHYDIGGAGVFMVTCSIPVYDKQKRLLGVVAADIEISNSATPAP